MILKMTRGLEDYSVEKYILLLLLKKNVTDVVPLQAPNKDSAYSVLLLKDCFSTLKVLRRLSSPSENKLLSDLKCHPKKSCTSRTVLNMSTSSHVKYATGMLWPSHSIPVSF